MENTSLSQVLANALQKYQITATPAKYAFFFLSLIISFTPFILVYQGVWEDGDFIEALVVFFAAYMLLGIVAVRVTKKDRLAFEIWVAFGAYIFGVWVMPIATTLCWIFFINIIIIFLGVLELIGLESLSNFLRQPSSWLLKNAHFVIAAIWPFSLMGLSIGVVDDIYEKHINKQKPADADASKDDNPST